jgi:glycosyltransferase involved in cell wall biosynthesis
MKKLGIVSSWNVRCGIAEYTRNMILAMDHPAKIFSKTEDQYLQVDEPFVVRYGDDYCNGLAEAVLKEKIDTLSIQHHQSLFSPQGDFRREMNELYGMGVDTVITIHHVFEDIDTTALSMARLIIVHDRHTKIFLADRGVPVGKINVIRHMAYPFSKLTIKEAREKFDLPEKPFIVGSSGFLFPHKQFDKILHILPQIGMAVGMKPVYYMLTPLHPDPASTKYLEIIRNNIQSLSLEPYVHLDTNFYCEEETVDRLAACDVIVLPHADTAGSGISASIMLAISSGRPIFTTDSYFMDGLEDAVVTFPHETPASGFMITLRNNLDRLNEISAAAEEYATMNSKENFGQLYRITFSL